MNTLLLIVTLVSLTLAVVLLVLNWRLIREEHRRSAARVEALLEAVSNLPDPAPVPAAAKLVEAAPPHLSAFVEEPAASAPLQVAATSIEPAVIASHELFHGAAQAPSGFRRLALPVSLGVVIVSSIVAGLLLWDHGGARPASTATAADAADDSAAIPFELISLRHERTANGLSITGLVRNPAGGQGMSDLNVVVFLFDRTGSLVRSASGPLDFRTLAPGDESPFTISLDKIASVGRYRVSFRADDKIVPHVDRRQDPAAVAAGFGGPTKLEGRSRLVAVASTH
jgi:hypothetical protein